VVGHHLARRASLKVAIRNCVRLESRAPVGSPSVGSRPAASLCTPDLLVAQGTNGIGGRMRALFDPFAC
jgi:hypothetical protein